MNRENQTIDFATATTLVRICLFWNERLLCTKERKKGLLPLCLKMAGGIEIGFGL